MKLNKKFFAIMLTVITTLSFMLTAYAAVPRVCGDGVAVSPDPRYIGQSGCSVSLVTADDGLGVDYASGFTQPASEVGVKNVKLQKKVGPLWITVTSVKKDYFTDTDSFVGGFVSHVEPSGAEYRISITYYAIFKGEEYSVSDKTPSLTY